ncbi:SpcZ [Nocardia terpenica]|nr:SpcZ [Nocardia terpenica]NQE92225.1 SpcZ [Nocardia terpenica]
MTADPASISTAAPTWLHRIVETIRTETGSFEISDCHTAPSLRVVHDWYTRALGPMLIEASATRGGSSAQEAVQAMHIRALAGEALTEDAWYTALEPALREIFEHAYPYTRAYTTAATAASAYAASHGYPDDEARRYGDSYAELNTTANARVHATANAKAHARALARAFSAGSTTAYTETYPSARLRAAVRSATADDPTRAPAIWSHLAETLGESLTRASS